MNISCEERVKLYFSYMNEKAEPDYYLFASYNLIETEADDGIYDGMKPIEAFNRRNNNAIKYIIVNFIYSKRVSNIEYCCLRFDKGTPIAKKTKITTVNELNLLENSGKDGIEYYWTTFDINEHKYKIAMFHKDFDHNSGNLHVLPGAMQIFEKNETEEWFKIKNEQYSEGQLEKTPTGKCTTGEIYAEEGWAPIPFALSPKEKCSNKLYMLWYSYVDICKHIRHVIEKEPFTNLEVNEKCKASVLEGQKEFYSVLKDKPFENMKLSYGRGTYYFLKFKKNRKGEICEEICSGYHISYIDGEGYFYDFDGSLHSYKKGNIYYINGEKKLTESPNDFIETEEGRGYWKLKYK